ncbi:hypothetical protein N7495_003928 [Penicillium taxi]|uniref:uncharacterized protein n=1 Tax=Penicillium taxi TaxID=168475 RepID=UPI0025455A2E|nr:uncharacterized protein N7495_003928 [Penicillium taxi]KAJ5899184.1 hypothetical protein N7495_003928 [Penicillium taxi]
MPSVLGSSACFSPNFIIKQTSTLLDLSDETLSRVSIVDYLILVTVRELPASNSDPGNDEAVVCWDSDVEDQAPPVVRKSGIAEPGRCRTRHFSMQPATIGELIPVLPNLHSITICLCCVAIVKDIFKILANDEIRYGSVSTFGSSTVFSSLAFILSIALRLSHLED